MGFKKHGGNIWDYDPALTGQWIDFSANINPLGMPLAGKELFANCLDLLVHYPLPYAQELKEGLADVHRVGADNVLVGNGSIELLYLIMRVLALKKVLIPVPTFSEYEFAAKANNIQCLFLKLSSRNNFAVSLTKLYAKVSQVNCIFLCNPNNPTGVICSKQELIKLADICKLNKVYLIIDEAFLDFVKQPDLYTMIPEVSRNRYVLVLRSLTKICAIAGLRLGYLIGNSKEINNIVSRQYPWSVNVLAQKVGAEIIRDRQYQEKTRCLIAKEREYLISQLRQFSGVTVYPSVANFILCELDENSSHDANTLSYSMEKYKILIRDCQNFRGLNKRFFRIAVRLRKENKRLVHALKKEIR